jgi:hypothetical protein
MKKQSKKNKIKIKKVSVVLDFDGKLHIEKYKKGYGVEGIMTKTKEKNKWNF